MDIPVIFYQFIIACQRLFVSCVTFTSLFAYHKSTSNVHLGQSGTSNIFVKPALFSPLFFR